MMLMYVMTLKYILYYYFIMANEKLRLLLHVYKSQEIC